MGGGSSGCKSGVTVPFKIEGTTADPKFVPDVGGVAAGMLKTQLGCAGSGVTGAKNSESDEPESRRCQHRWAVQEAKTVTGLVVTQRHHGIYAHRAPRGNVARQQRYGRQQERYRCVRRRVVSAHVK